jgi:hypothetical protein
MTKELKWLSDIIKNYAEVLFAEKREIPNYTKHNLEHSENILQILYNLVHNRIKLSSDEALILIGTAYFHDIALFYHEDLVSQWYVKDIYLNHGEFSAQYIREKLFYRIISSEKNYAPKIREHVNIFEAIAIISDYHTSKDKSILKKKLDADQSIRLPLLAGLFTVADDLHITTDRVNISNILNDKITINNKELLILRSTIQAIEISDTSITIFFYKIKDIEESKYISQIINPLLYEISASLKFLNNSFRKFKIKTIRLEYIIHEKLSLEATQGLIDVLDQKILTNKINRRRSYWDRELKNIIFNKGVLRQQLIGDEFHIFRRWGSSTHRLFANRLGLQKGGGYYLSWNGFGIAIDPGYDFLSNVFSMRTLQFSSQDIQAAVISHVHDDHTQDFEPLISLQYRLRRRNSNQVQIPFNEFPTYCSEGVRWKYAPVSAVNPFLKLVPLVPTKNSRRNNLVLPGVGAVDPFLTTTGLNIEAMLSYHSEMPWHLNNTGLSLKIASTDLNKPFSLGYTSDTSFEGEARNLLINFFKDVDLLVLHLGNMKEGRNRYPPHHLGEGGCIDLISHLKFECPKLFLLSEFGADEFITTAGIDDRIPFTQYVETMSGARNFGKRVLPADIGLRIKLDSNNFLVWGEEDPMRFWPTSDNPRGFWRDPIDIIPTIIHARDHEIHYLV